MMLPKILSTPMLGLLLRLWVVIFLVSCEQLAKLAEQADSAKNDAPYEVLKVSDGDTYQLLDTRTNEKVKVRLFGVDAPEKKQAYGLNALDFASNLAKGKKVNLRPHAKDQYGRTVGEIILADGRNINEELLRNGCVWHYKQYSKDPKWAAMEEEARAARKGLWAGKRPTPPWEYRKRNREKTGNSFGKKSKKGHSNTLAPEENKAHPDEESDLEEMILQPLTPSGS